MVVASIIAAGLAIVGGVLSAVAAARQGQAANATAKFNAQVLREQAKQEQDFAKLAADDERRKGSRALASFRAGLGGSGITNFGAPLLVQSDVASQIELGARRTEVTGNIKGRRLQQEADLRRFSGRNAREQGFFSAGTSILNSASRAVGSFGSFGGS